MTSAVSAGTADRIVARTLFKVLRAGSETWDRYWSTVLKVELLFAEEARARAHAAYRDGHKSRGCGQPDVA